MKPFFVLLVALIPVAFVPVVLAQSVESGGGAFPLPEEAPMSAEQRAEIVAQIEQNRRALRAAGVLSSASPRTDIAQAWPLRAAPSLGDYGYHGVSNFVDQVPAFGSLGDYFCGARTYDVPGYNHAGTDYFTWPYGWHKMDTDAVEVVAAASGVIVLKSDGNFDRNCEFGQGQWNAVYVEHEDGSVAWYGHLKNGSVTAKGVGESVAAGEYLGVVGSSGNSTGPHLHLEVYDADGALVDPYEGACNTLNATTLWAEQPSYFDSAINAVMTHSAAPGFPTCPNSQDVVNAQDAFDPGDLMYVAGYYRDQLQGQLSTYTVRRPDGTVWQTWTNASSAAHYAASYWYWTRTLPADATSGTWTIDVEFEGETYTHTFTVGMVTAEEGAAAAAAFGLSEAYPNPLRDTGRLTLTLATPQRVRVAVYDVLGREVVELAEGIRPAGEHEVVVDARALPSGLYVVRAASGDGVATRSLVVQR